MVLQSLQRFDHALYISLANRKHARLIAVISRWISKTGDGYLYVLLGGGALIFTPEIGRDFFLTTLVAFSVELPLYVLIKNSFKRNRPCDVLHNLPAFVSPSDRFSLPSGHTAAAFVMAVMIADFYPDFAALAYVWASLIGASRILLRVHFPTDIGCGILLGSSAAWLSLTLMV